jgi:hypothetical protein
MRRQAIVDAVHATADALSASIDHMKVVEDLRREYAIPTRGSIDPLRDQSEKHRQYPQQPRSRAESFSVDAGSQRSESRS